MTSGPELILARGKIFTCDPELPRAEALAVHKGRVVAVGTNGDIEPMRGPSTHFIDLDGALVLPGFSDNHTHFLEGALGLGNIDLREVRGKEEFRRVVTSSLAGLAPGEWLAGGYWNEESWGGESPDRVWIDDLSPENPLLLFRCDIHQAVCNGVALQLCGITAGTEDPDGGLIGRDGRGEPNGLLFETAVELARSKIPPPSGKQVRALLKQAMAMANSLGITHLCHMIAGPEEVGLYFDMEREGELTCRFDLLPPIQSWERFARAGMRSGAGLELVALGAMKGFLDGSLGSRTALMFEPYTDDPGNHGLIGEIAEPPGSLEALMKSVDRAGLQMAMHAIGDAAIRIALDMYERVRRESPYPGLRHRVEHAQHPNPDDIARFGRLNLVASCQPVHLVGDGCYAEERIGPDRTRHSYPMRSLLDAGATVTFGSDWPVADINPLEGIWAAVTRQTADGRNPGGWVPQEKVTVEEAVAAYTSAGAFACGREGQWGRLAPGLDADLIVLDRDIFSCGPEKIRRTKVLRTLLRGRQVFPGRE